MISVKSSRFLVPEWPAPANIRAAVTTRACGNLATHVQHDPLQVEANRRQLQMDLMLPHSPRWIEQVHGIDVVNMDEVNPVCNGDAALSRRAQTVCAILTADCLPLLVCSVDGEKIAAIHAGWRGLLAGVIDSTLKALQTPADDLLVWLGPAIGPDHFIVGSEVRDQYISRHADYAAGFTHVKDPEWRADLYKLARINLLHLGIRSVYGGGLCTVCDSERFYSYRREQGASGRMASLIWRNN